MCVGKVRPPHEAAAREYEARIAERVPIRIDEVASEPLQHGDDRSRRVEAERITARLLPEAWVVAMAPDGTAPRSSEALAAWLGARLEVPKPTAFIIGGAAGIDGTLLRRADERMSLGPLTLPHQLARVVLGEQLFRGLAILAGHPYHH